MDQNLELTPDRQSAHDDLTTDNQTTHETLYNQTRACENYEKLPKQKLSTNMYRYEIKTHN